MKITRNTTEYDTRDLRRIICKTHIMMKKLEGRTAPNWNALRIVVRGTTINRVKGYAYYHGQGGAAWDVHLTLPPGVNERRFAWLVYHELMHTYGYKHRKFTDVTPLLLAVWFPDNALIRFKTKPEKRPPQELRHQRVIVKLSVWQSKAKRAATAITKLKAQLRYYERAAARRENSDATP